MTLWNVRMRLPLEKIHEIPSHTMAYINWVKYLMTCRHCLSSVRISSSLCGFRFCPEEDVGSRRLGLGHEASLVNVRSSSKGREQQWRIEFDCQSYPCKLL